MQSSYSSAIVHHALCSMHAFDESMMLVLVYVVRAFVECTCLHPHHDVGACGMSRALVIARTWCCTLAVAVVVALAAALRYRLIALIAATRGRCGSRTCLCGMGRMITGCSQTTCKRRYMAGWMGNSGQIMENWH